MYREYKRYHLIHRDSDEPIVVICIDTHGFMTLEAPRPVGVSFGDAPRAQTFIGKAINDAAQA